MRNPLTLTTVIIGVTLALPTVLAVADNAEIPSLDLSRVDPAVRAQLAEHRSRLDALLAGEDAAEQEALAEALFGMGQLYLAYDYVEAGVACLEAAHQRRPEDADVLYLLGYGYDRQGRRPESAGAFEKSLALAPDRPIARLRLGNLKLALGEPEAAGEQFERAHAADATCVGALYGLGEIARRSRDDQAAADYFTRALERAPDATQVRYSLGLTLRRLGRLEEAEAHLEQADWRRLNFGGWLGCADPLVARLAEITTGAPAHLLRAAQAGFKGLPEVEVAEYKKAVAANPGDAVARANLGTVLYDRGDLEGAAEQYRQAVRLDPDSAGYRHDLGQILLELGSPGEATALLQAAVELNPRLKDAHLKLAEIHLRAGRFNEAAEHCRGVIAVDPLHRKARVQLAMSLFRLGRRGEAISELGRLMDDHPPEDPAERLQLATMLAQLGDPARAMRHFTAVAESDAPAAVRAQARAALARLGG